MKKLLALSFMFLLTSCVTNKFVSSKSYDVFTLNGSNVFIYTMLDIRENDFGNKMLDSLNKNIANKLHQHGVQSTLLAFNDSIVSQSFSMSNSGVLPVEQFVKESEGLENEKSAKYRLVILPSQMTVSGAWRYFNITWMLQDIKTNRIVWKGVSKGEHLVAYSVNESPDQRAEVISKSLFQQLEASKLL